MERFIKVSLVGLGWSKSPAATIHDHQRVTNLIAEHLRGIDPLDGRKEEARNLRISICDQVDKIHFIDPDEAIIIPI